MLGLGLGITKIAGLRSLAQKLLSILRVRSTYYENGAASKEEIQTIYDYELLDKATILLTPTATSDARVHSVKTYTGDELVTDGSFNNGLSDWDSFSNVTIVNGAARFNNIGLSGANAYLIENSILEAGKTYKFECDVISTNGKDLVLERANNTSIGATTTGHKIIYFTQGTQPHFTIKRLTSETDVTIDNISVTEADADFDFDRASSATRINSSGLVQDMQSITDPELVLNGDFEELGDELITNGDFSNWTGDNPDNYLVLNEDANNYVTESNGQLRMVSDNSATIAIRPQPTTMLTVGKTYKVSVDLTFTTGTLNISGVHFNTSGTKVFYLTAASTYLQLAKESALDVLIDNVSVQQVDPNDSWTLVGDFEIDDTKAFITSASQYSQITSQQGVNFLDNGKTYKLEADITTSIDNALAYRVSGGAVTPISFSDIVDGKYVSYFTMSQDGYFWFQTTGSYTGLNATIDNISVKDITFSTDVDLARINYDSNGENGHILLEPTSANLIPYSEDFTQLTPPDNSVLATSNQAISPDGTLNADKLIPANGNVQSNGGAYSLFTSIAGTDYSVSVFVKQAEYRYVTFTYGSSNAYGFHFDLQDGVILQDLNNAAYTGISREVESFGNGWYRLKVSLTDDTGSSSRHMSVRPANAMPTATNNNYSTTGDGTSGIYAWGFQLEALSYATSYIPSLTGSTVTRAAETLLNSGNSTLINSTEGVLYAEIAGLVNTDSIDRIISLSDNTTTNRVEMKLSSSGAIKGRFDSAASDIEFGKPGLTITNFNKIALVWLSGKCALFINGVKEREDLTFSTFASDVLFDLSFKSPYNDVDGSRDFYGKVKALAVFDEALEDDELELLTGVTNYGSFGELASANGYTII